VREDPYKITVDQINCLADLIEYPTKHTQRCVDELAFRSTSGQQWTRTVQVRLPDEISGGRGWRVVSLGMFKRRRFPDFVVTDASGRRVNLLTRDQHGTVLTHALLNKYLNPLEVDPRDVVSQPPGSPTKQAYDALAYYAYSLLTSAGDAPDPKKQAGQVAVLFGELLKQLNIDESLAVRQKSLIGREVTELLDVTQYLAWVLGEPGEVVSLQATYTTRDARQALESESSMRGENREPYPEPVRRMYWYRAFGLAPLNYAFSVPSHDHAGSYYFTLDPPRNTRVTYLDWESGNSFAESSELDSALESVHLNQGDISARPAGEASRTRGGVINAYVRCDVREHKKIAAGALLNLIFVFLIAGGRFTNGSGTAQTWLILTPTILLAYLAQQQRHYYSYATRKQRAVLWTYLAISVTFLVATSFSHAQGQDAGTHWGWFATGAALLLAVSSAAVFAWYAPLGQSFGTVTRRWTRTSMAQRSADGSNATQRLGILPYDYAVLRYCDWIARGVVFAAVAVLVATIIAWGPQLETKIAAPSSASATAATSSASATSAAG